MAHELVTVLSGVNLRGDPNMKVDPWSKDYEDKPPEAIGIKIIM